MQLKHPVFDEESLKNNDEKVRFFTGLTNWDTLNTTVPVCSTIPLN